MVSSAFGRMLPGTRLRESGHPRSQSAWVPAPHSLGARLAGMTKEELPAHPRLAGMKAFGSTPRGGDDHAIATAPSSPLSIALLALLLGALAPLSGTEAQRRSGHPIIPGWYAEPEAHVFEGQYWICEADQGLHRLHSLPRRLDVRGDRERGSDGRARGTLAVFLVLAVRAKAWCDRSQSYCHVPRGSTGIPFTGVTPDADGGHFPPRDQRIRPTGVTNAAECLRHVCRIVILTTCSQSPCAVRHFGAADGVLPRGPGLALLDCVVPYPSWEVPCIKHQPL